MDLSSFYKDMFLKGQDEIYSLISYILGLICPGVHLCNKIMVLLEIAGRSPRLWTGLATAVIGGISLMFRRTKTGARIGTCGVGILMLFTCILFVRNAFGLVMLVLIGLSLTGAGWYLPGFWVKELYALIAATTCLNAITSVRVLFMVTESNIGGVTNSSDAMLLI